jgi:hypothetical protein
MGGAYSRHGRREKRTNLLIGKADGKKALERRWRKWDDNIKFHLK